MPASIVLQGLCAIVSETEDVTSSPTLDIVLIDAAKLGQPVHLPLLTLPAAQLDDPDNLTASDPSDPRRRILHLEKRRLCFLAEGKPPSGSGFSAENLHLLPSLKKACGDGTVDIDCLTKPPKYRAVSSRVELPPGGKLRCADADRTPTEWSFFPKVTAECYHERFVLRTHFDLPTAGYWVIEVTDLAGDHPHRMTLQSMNSADLVITNEPSPAAHTHARSSSRGGASVQSPPQVEVDHLLTYYELLERTFPDPKPRPRNTSDCTVPPFDDGGLGCAPFLLTKKR